MWVDGKRTAGATPAEKRKLAAAVQDAFWDEHGPNVDLFAEYTRTHKDGEKPFGMAFGSPGGNALEVLQPIEQTIHDFRLRGTWATERWQLQASYVMSVFVNDLSYVRADNPCQPTPAIIAPCAAGDTGTTKQFGTVSLPPNNMAHTFSLQGGVNLPMRTRISSNFTYGLRLQNDDFLPQTSTNGLPATTPSLALPQKSLNGGSCFSGLLHGASSPRTRFPLAPGSCGRPRPLTASSW